MLIAEVGLNHMGSVEYADEYMTSIVVTDVDAITFQIREKEFYNNELRVGQPKKQFLLDWEYYSKAAALAKLYNKQFGIALADPHALQFCESIGVDFYKVLSWDIKNFSFLDVLFNKTTKHVFLSTGMSSYKTIDEFYHRYKDFSSRITLIHTQLTPEVEDTNLKAISHLKKKYPLSIAFGNHCKNLKVIYSALSFEPSDLFFYVKGRRGICPDEGHAVSLLELEDFCEELKFLQLAIGGAAKQKMENLIEKEKK